MGFGSGGGGGGELEGEDGFEEGGCAGLAGFPGFDVGGVFLVEQERVAGYADCELGL